ncbi:hypothetical protein MPER_05131, partial [Moniliophthora perniciosa FA553]
GNFYMVVPGAQLKVKPLRGFSGEWFLSVIIKKGQFVIFWHPFRGLKTSPNITHIEVSCSILPRNYYPVADIKRTLDAMSLVKLNTFHWHVVDSQSFPLQVPGFTELADKGAYAPSAVYSPEDVQDLVSYAAARGIDVIAEIDIPGHTSVIS